MTHLVYYEATDDIHAAISRKKQIKGWLRSRKVVLIESINPEWDDLAETWFKGEDERVLEKQASL